MLQNEDQSKFWPIMCSQALNRLPVLSGLTTFKRIMDTVSSDPLTGTVQERIFFKCLCP